MDLLPIGGVESEILTCSYCDKIQWISGTPRREYNSLSDVRLDRCRTRHHSQWETQLVILHVYPWAMARMDNNVNIPSEFPKCHSNIPSQSPLSLQRVHVCNRDFCVQLSWVWCLTFYCAVLVQLPAFITMANIFDTPEPSTTTPGLGIGSRVKTNLCGSDHDMAPSRKGY